MLTPRKITALGFILVLAVLPGCKRFFQNGISLVKLTEVNAKQSLAPEVTELIVTNRVGTVEVTAHDSDEITVVAAIKIDKSKAATTPPGSFEDHVSVSVEGQRLVIADKHMGQPDEKEWGISLVIGVPARVSVEIENGVGDVRVKNTSGQATVTNGVGDVHIESASVGKLRATTGVGDLVAIFQTATGPIVLETGTGGIALSISKNAPTNDVELTVGVGDVRLDLPQDAKGSFDLETGVGDIAISGYEGVSKSKNSGIAASASGRVGQEGPEIIIKTGVGDIQLD